MGCKTACVGDVCRINARQYSPKENWPRIQYLDTGSVTRGSIDKPRRFDPVNDKVPSRARRKVQKQSIVYSMVRPNQEHYALIENPPADMLVSTGFSVIDADTSIVVPQYLYYALTRKETTVHFQALAEQSVSTYPTLGVSDLACFQIDLPELETQNKIASLLSLFDEKIAINNRTNDYLAG